MILSRLGTNVRCKEVQRPRDSRRHLRADAILFLVAFNEIGGELKNFGGEDKVPLVVLVFEKSSPPLGFKLAAFSSTTITSKKTK